MADRRPGRPPIEGISGALIQAAERIMTTDGFSKLTVDGLASEIGTTRPTFYRRYPGVAQLALDVITSRFGNATPIDTGSLANDLLALQRADVAKYSSPLLANSLPGLVEYVRHDASVRELYREQFVAPRRRIVVQIVDAASARGEITAARSETLDLDLLDDLLLGPILTRALLPVPGRLDDALARTTAQLGLDYLTTV